MNISFGLPGYPIFLSSFQKNIAILGAVNDIFTQSFNEDP